MWICVLDGFCRDGAGGGSGRQLMGEKLNKHSFIFSSLQRGRCLSDAGLRSSISKVMIPSSHVSLRGLTNYSIVCQESPTQSLPGPQCLGAVIVCPLSSIPDSCFHPGLWVQGEEVWVAGVRDLGAASWSQWIYTGNKNVLDSLPLQSSHLNYE